MEVRLGVALDCRCRRRAAIDCSPINSAGASSAYKYVFSHLIHTVIYQPYGYHFDVISLLLGLWTVEVLKMS